MDSVVIVIDYNIQGDWIDEERMVVDYNTQGDWIDDECRDCGRLYGKHTVDCRGIMREWIRLAAHYGRVTSASGVIETQDGFGDDESWFH